MQDVWDVVDSLIEEVKHFNNEGKSFDVSRSINAQLPFFSCKNLFHSKENQTDIQRYIYCQDFNVQPYPGGYGEQPALWVEKSFIIKNSLAKLNKDKIEDGNKSRK